MTVYHVEGNLFHGQGDTFDFRVVTVNCKGAMGAGLAKEAAKRFPSLEEQYKAECRWGRWYPGRTTAYGVGPTEDNWVFILAATKDDWRDPSQQDWVSHCLAGIRSIAAEEAAFSDDLITVALPPLGAGLGGLDPVWVLNRVHEFFDHEPMVDVYYFLPR